MVEALLLLYYYYNITTNRGSTTVEMKRLLAPTRTMNVHAYMHAVGWVGKWDGGQEWGRALLISYYYRTAIPTGACRT